MRSVEANSFLRVVHQERNKISSREKIKRSFEKLFRYLYGLFCLSVCLYQILDICDIYFSYTTTTFVSYENQSEISLPAITFCLDKRYLLKPEYLDQININKSDDEGTQNMAVNEFVANLTVKEQFDALYDFRETFNECIVVQPKEISPDYLTGAFVNCEAVAPIRRLIDYDK